MESRQIKGVLFEAFGTLCRIESPRFPYRSIMKRWKNGAADCYQAIMTWDVPLNAWRTRGLGRNCRQEPMRSGRICPDDRQYFNPESHPQELTGPKNAGRSALENP